MTFIFSIFVKTFVIFGYFLVVGYSEWFIERLLPDCAIKRLLLRKF